MEADHRVQYSGRTACAAGLARWKGDARLESIELSPVVIALGVNSDCMVREYEGTEKLCEDSTDVVWRESMRESISAWIPVFQGISPPKGAREYSTRFNFPQTFHQDHLSFSKAYNGISQC